MVSVAQPQCASIATRPWASTRCAPGMASQRVPTSPTNELWNSTRTSVFTTSATSAVPSDWPADGHSRNHERRGVHPAEDAECATTEGQQPGRLGDSQVAGVDGVDAEQVRPPRRAAHL